MLQQQEKSIVEKTVENVDNFLKRRIQLLLRLTGRNQKKRTAYKSRPLVSLWVCSHSSGIGVNEKIVGTVGLKFCDVVVHAGD